MPRWATKTLGSSEVVAYRRAPRSARLGGRRARGRAGRGLGERRGEPLRRDQARVVAPAGVDRKGGREKGRVGTPSGTRSSGSTQGSLLLARGGAGGAAAGERSAVAMHGGK